MKIFCENCQNWVDADHECTLCQRDPRVEPLGFDEMFSFLEGAE